MHIHIGTLVSPFQCLLHHPDFHVPLYRPLFIFDLGFFGRGRHCVNMLSFFWYGVLFYCVVHWSSSSKSRNYLVCMPLFGQNKGESLFIYFGFNILPIWKIRFNDFVIQLASENGRARSRYSTKPHLNLDICAQFRIFDCSYHIQPIFICVKEKSTRLLLQFKKKLTAVLHFIHTADACGFIWPNALQTVETTYTLIKFALAFSTSTVFVSKLNGRKMVQNIKTAHWIQQQTREKNHILSDLSFATINLN